MASEKLSQERTDFLRQSQKTPTTPTVTDEPTFHGLVLRMAAVAAGTQAVAVAAEQTAERVHKAMSSVEKSVKDARSNTNKVLSELAQNPQFGPFLKQYLDIAKFLKENPSADPRGNYTNTLRLLEQMLRQFVKGAGTLNFGSLRQNPDDVLKLFDQGRL